MHLSPQDQILEVFISYDHRDKEIVDQIHRRLDEAGLKTWKDSEDIRAGDHWQSSLETALRSSRNVVVFVGPNNLSDWQRVEIQMAQKLSMEGDEPRIIPVLLPGAPAEETLPLFLSLIECVKLNASDRIDEADLDELLTAIKGNLLSAGEKQAVIEKRTRAAVLRYYQSQEANCEHLVFRPSQTRARSMGSDVYVQLHLLSEKIQSTSIPEKPDSIPLVETQHNKSSSTPKEFVHSVFDRFKTKKDSNAPPEMPDAITQTFRERESWDTVFQNHGLRLVFKGSAGSGKSFSLAQELRKRLSLARRELENSRSLNELELPILVKANALVGSGYKSITEALLANVSETVDPDFKSWWQAAFTIDRGRRLFIVIDGLDELPETSENRFRKLMQELDELENASVVISCRTMYYDSRKDWLSWPSNVIEIAPLNAEQQNELIEKWFGSDYRSKALQSFLETNYFARLFCRAPIVLTLVCRTYINTGSLSEGNLTYASLYEKVVKELLAGRWRDERPHWTQDSSVVEQDSAERIRLNLVAVITWKIFELRSSNHFTEVDWLQVAKSVSPSPELDPHNLLKELEQVGLIIDDGPSNGPRQFSFAHRTLFEYFAAKGLVANDPRWMKTIVKHMWCEPGWEEVIRFAASMRGTSEKLLKAIAKETGPATTPVRPLQRLGGLFDNAWRISFVSLFFIVVGIVLFVATLPAPELDQLKQHSLRLFELFGKTSEADARERPFEVIKWRTNDVLEFYAIGVDAIYRDLIFGSKQGFRRLYWLFLALDVLHPIALLTLLFSSLGLFLTWLAQKLLYRKSFINQDDIFRTGLRLQAEVVGLAADSLPEPEIRRVVDDLLASERTKSLNCYGATEEGYIPESLLLLVGGNKEARKILNESCRKLVEQQSRDLQKMDRSYRRRLLWYRRWLRIVTKQDVEVTLKGGDIKNLPGLIDLFYSPRRLVSDHLQTRLSSVKGLNHNPPNESMQSTKSEAEWLADLNLLIQGPSLFEPAAFKYLTLRAETIELLAREPAGKDLARLNRLLLEAALPGTIFKLQKRWIRIASRFWWLATRQPLFAGRDLKNLPPGSELESALRIFSLLPATDNGREISSLLEKTANATRHLLNAGEISQTFTLLDVHAAKALALAGGATHTLIDLCNRRDYYGYDETYTSAAIRELSSVNEKQGIRVALAYLAHWKDDTEYKTTQRKKEVVGVLRSAEFGHVIEELVEMKLEDSVVWKRILFQWFFDYYPSLSAKDFLQKIVDNEILSDSIKEFARECLRDSSNKEWFHQSEWLERWARDISKHLEKGELDRAVSCFDKSITSYQVDYASSNLSAAIDKLAAACDESLLGAALGKNGHHYARSRNSATILARLGQSKNGKPLNRALIKWIEKVNDPSTHANLHHPDIREWRVSALNLLGELGTTEARQTLLAILEHMYRPRERMRDFFSGTPDTYSAALISALGKFDHEETFEAIQREVKMKRHWTANYIAARSLAEHDALKALKLLLKGQTMRGDAKWKPEYGVEPQLVEYAFKCKARIRKVTQDENVYVVTQARKFVFSVPAT